MRLRTKDEVVVEALRRLELAISEVRVVERKKEGQVVSETVANLDALPRAKQAYQTTALLIGKARQLDGTALGTPQADRPFIVKAMERLEEYRQQLARLETLAQAA